MTVSGNKYINLLQKQIEDFAKARDSYNAAQRNLDEAIEPLIKNILAENSHDDMDMLRKAMPSDCITAIFLIDIQKNDMEPRDEKGI